MKKRRATKIIVSKRLEEVVRIRLDGAEFWDLREFIREKETDLKSVWALKPNESPMSDTQVWRYLTRADKLCRVTNDTSRKRMLNLSIARRNNLYAKSVLAGDYRTALAVLSDLDRLRGLYPAKAIELTKKKSNDPVDDMTDAELIANLKDLRSREDYSPNPNDPDDNLDLD